MQSGKSVGQAIYTESCCKARPGEQPLLQVDTTLGIRSWRRTLNLLLLEQCPDLGALIGLCLYSSSTTATY